MFVDDGTPVVLKNINLPIICASCNDQAFCGCGVIEVADNYLVDRCIDRIFKVYLYHAAAQQLKQILIVSMRVIMLQRPNSSLKAIAAIDIHIGATP